MSPAASDTRESATISEVKPQSHQGNGPEGGLASNAPSSRPAPFAAFYRGEPEVLGTTQIFSGMVLISLGIPIILASLRNYFFLMMYSGIPLWSGILYITSGSLSVAASVKPTKGKITASLVMNILSSISAVFGVVVMAMDLFLIDVLYYRTLRYFFCAQYNSDFQCIGEFKPLPVYVTVMVFMLLLFMMMMFITISTSVFACKTVCRSSNVTGVVVYQASAMKEPVTTINVPIDSPAVGTSDLKT
ncbi:membrane-spanning 4-domains subfamily A member 4D-like [Dendropsophus ebraccatus]|uniref:membrane-spanning 4-domains subfamily A member 4D-like n=1 Tax=Dendropsophus ebraccatus TaxID=150705 RepID=UPI003831CE5E